MRLPDTAHLALPWRIHALVPDFTLEDVWALPASGASEDFDRVIDLATRGDDLIAHAGWPTQVLWQVRDLLGAVFGLGRINGSDPGPHLPIPGTNEPTLQVRLPDDLRGTVDHLRFDDIPMRPLFRTADEFAAELSNRTVHAVMHLGWAAGDDGLYHGRMAVYVKPRGTLGSAYMAFIKPFRRLVVYPALLRQIDRAWDESAVERDRAAAGAA